MCQRNSGTPGIFHLLGILQLKDVTQSGHAQLSLFHSPGEKYLGRAVVLILSSECQVPSELTVLMKSLG
jgi:hypothetical protein